MDTHVKKTGLQIGSTLAIILILFYLFVYISDYRYMTSVITGFILIFFCIIFGFTASYLTKKRLGGLITFKNAFIPYFLTVIIGVLGSTLFLYVLYGLIDTETGNKIHLEMIELSKQQAINFEMSPEQAEQSLEMVTRANPYSIGQMLMSAGTRVLMLCVPGFLAAVLFKNQSEPMKNRAEVNENLSR